VGTSRRLRELARSLGERARFPDQPAVVALSGGADSAACAWLARAAGLTVRAVHVHHRLPASDRLEEAAGAVAGSLDLDFDSLRLDAAPRSETHGRVSRHRALEAALQAGEALLTGHTRDDQAETVLANLLRGSGVDGLAGIPARRGPIVHPLLGVWRTETRELATLAGLPWFDDPTNADDTALRNRIRRSLIPALEAGFQPNLRDVLARTAEHAAGDARALDDLAGAIRPVPAPGGGVRLALGALMAAGPALGGRAIRSAATLLAPPYPPGSAGLDRVWRVVTGQDRATQLAGGLTARRAGPWLELRASDGTSTRQRASLPDDIEEDWVWPTSGN
jgi:tRNA(Ile)-lysidine synthase